MSSQGVSYVVPGDVVAVEEEYSEGQNVYVDYDTGVLRVASIGKLKLDNVNKVAEVIPARRLKSPKKGATVLGLVTQVRENLAFVDIYGEVALEPRPGRFIEYSGVLDGVITPESVGVDRVDDIMNFVRPNDIILARVMSTISPYLLSLKGPQLGVIYALCSRCGEVLALEGGSLKCPACGNVENRKLSTFANSKLIRLDIRRLILRRFQ
ncbi:exosome complex RNA-binding protein Csl4 [Acidilobus sp.]|uniref:exosome complex RNA-binding protein Csl4 n=1 Tax=Acidilobus sp. TaxID=1872109 RepID=UPI003CFEA23E